ncbi:MAG: CAAD domain-containing protein [Microcoleaceae cyanobacterium]
MSESKTPDINPPSPVDVKAEPGNLENQEFSTDEMSNQLEDIKQKVVEVLSELPGYVSGFFSEYQKPIISIILVISVFVTLKILFAVVDAMNDIPLLAPLFELIGIGFSGWFVYRYLLRASNRQELVSEFEAY